MTTLPTTSRHLRGAGEVLLLPKLRAGFVDNQELILSYGQRLKTMLTALFELRRAAADAGSGDDAGPIERLRTVYDVQWTVLEQEQCLLVAASFDRSWEDYFRLLYEVTGPLLDAIFMHCEGYRDFTGDFSGFAAWVRGVQRECNFFYLANAQSTTDDARYLKQLLKAGNDAEGLHVDDPIAGKVPARELARRARDLMQAIEALYGLRKFFPDHEMLTGRSARCVFDLAMAGVFYSQRERLEGLLQQKLLPPAVAHWARPIVDAEVHRLADRVRTAKPVELGADALDDIQGGVLRDYGPLDRGAAVLIHCEDREAWDAFVNDMIERVTTESQAACGQKLRCNVALSYPGLERAGLTKEELGWFPLEFREGMQARAGLLGDVDDPAYPDDTAPFREVGGVGERLSMRAVDALVLFQLAASSEEADTCIAHEVERLQALTGVHVLFVQSLFREFVRLPDGAYAQREPFGFLEGHPSVSSQPVPSTVLCSQQGRVDLTCGAAEGDKVALGELLLGYENRHGENPYSAAGPWLKNGTFLVVRKLEQNVDQFKLWAEQVAEALARSGGLPQSASDEVGRAKALLLGRHLDGTPLVPTRGAPNDFDYAGEQASRCPLAAHIRRANPRTAKTPRILRRRFSFDDSARDSGNNGMRGTFFMALNADIGGQFEVIQRWVNGGNSTGTHSDRRDPIAGQRGGADLPYYVPDGNGDMQPVQLSWGAAVRLLWGCYFFMPSRSALRALLQVRGDDDDARVEAGRKIIERLTALAASASQETIRNAWKQVIEEPANYEHANAVWACIREQHAGVLPVPGVGVLVGSLNRAREILADSGERFSVRDYRKPLSESLGEHYLALDRAPATERCRYEGESRTANRFFRSLSYQSAYALACGHTQSRIRARPGQDSSAVRRFGDRTLIDVGALAERVVARCAQQWLGLTTDPQPSDDELTAALHNAVLVSRYVFQTDPAPALEEAAKATHAHFAQTTGLQGELSKHMQEESDVVRDRAAHGAAVGFAAPAIASIQSLLDLWATSGELWAIALRARSSEPAAAWFKQRVIDGLATRPVPALLYRRAVGDGRADERVGEPRVLLGLGSIYADALRAHAPDDNDPASNTRLETPTGQKPPCAEPPESWLFGGASAAVDQGNASGTSHGCPAREAGLGVIAGTLAALLTLPDLRVERPSVLSFVSPPDEAPNNADQL